MGRFVGKRRERHGFYPQVNAFLVYQAWFETQACRASAGRGEAPQVLQLYVEL